MADLPANISDLWGGGGNDPYTSSSGGGSFDFGGALGAVGSLAGAFGGFLGSQGQTAADLASAKGYEAESTAYQTAASYASANIPLAEESTAVQRYQQQRTLGLTIGKEEAGIAGAGFAPGGSGLSLLRSSMAQGALAKGMIGVQGAINVNAYQAQATSDIGLSNQATLAEQAAKAAASSSSSSGIMGLLGGVLKTGAQLLPMILAAAP